MESTDDSTDNEFDESLSENADCYYYRHHEDAHNSTSYYYDQLIELYKCRDPNFQTCDGATPLLIICDALRSNVRNIPSNIDKNFMLCELAKSLLKRGANPNIKDKFGNEPLHYAVQSGNYPFIKLLVEYGANRLNLSHGMGWLLYTATVDKNVPLMRKSVKWGCSIFDAGKGGYTPLLIATKMNFYDGVKWFLKKAGERAIELVNKRANNGATCVMEASVAGYEKSKRNSDCNITGSHLWFPNGEVHPIAVAALHNHPKCIELLLPHVNHEVLSKTVVDPILAATMGDSYDSIVLLLKSGYPVPNYRVEEIGMLAPYAMPLFKRQYCTALRDAEWRQNVLVVELLIKAGAKMTYTNKCFSPFVSTVWRHSCLEILLQFLQNDVDINAMSDERKCDVPDALLVSLSMSKSDQLMLLLISGLDPMLKNWCKCKNGYSLLHDVINSADINDIKALLKLLLSFSPAVPACCNEIADVIGSDLPKIPTLLHLCRLAIRKSFATSQLLCGRFAENLPIPSKLKDYLSFYHRGILIHLRKFTENCEEMCIRNIQEKSNLLI